MTGPAVLEYALAVQRRSGGVKRSWCASGRLRPPRTARRLPCASRPFHLRPRAPHPPLMTSLFAPSASFAPLRFNPRVHVRSRAFAWLSRAEKNVTNARPSPRRRPATHPRVHVRSSCGGVRSVYRKKCYEHTIPVRSRLRGPSCLRGCQRASAATAGRDSDTPTLPVRMGCPHPGTLGERMRTHRVKR